VANLLLVNYQVRNRMWLSCLLLSEEQDTAFNYLPGEKDDVATK
jgi:hypothetical protein